MKYFKVHAKSFREGVIVKLVGELDAHTCVMADHKLEEALGVGAKKVFVDCSQLRYLSSAGLGVLLSHLQACTLKGTSMVLCNVQPKVNNILNILGMQQLIKIKGSVREAITEA